MSLNKIMSASRSLLWRSEVRLKQLVDQSHAWWHIFSTQLLMIIHWVTTFCVGDNHDILGISLSCGFKQQNEHAFSLCLVWQLARTSYLPWLSRWSPTENVVTKWLTKSWLHTISPSMWWSQKPFEYISPLIITMSMTFCETDHSKKSHDIVTDQAMSQKCHEACIDHTNRFEYHLWLSRLCTWRWHGFCFSQIFVWHCQWHFATLVLRMAARASFRWGFFLKLFLLSLFLYNLFILVFNARLF